MNNPVDDYLEQQEAVQKKYLQKIRAIIKKAVPDAVEGMAYGMPTYKYRKKPLIYFAAAKNHVGLYATPSANSVFAEELKKYKTGNGSIQFQVSEKLPEALIREMVNYKKAEIDDSLAAKG